MRKDEVAQSSNKPFAEAAGGGQGGLSPNRRLERRKKREVVETLPNLKRLNKQGGRKQSFKIGQVRTWKKTKE